ncbi:MAG: hypothetical protein MHM6MM_007686, partial [Cercozoa sp. M6MM]
MHPFLLKKQFHVHRKDRVHEVYVAEQEAKQRKKRLEDRKKILENERLERDIVLQSSDRGGHKQRRLDFLYDAPPGMITTLRRERVEEERKQLEEELLQAK